MKERNGQVQVFFNDSGCSCSAENKSLTEGEGNNTGRQLGLLPESR